VGEVASQQRTGRGLWQLNPIGVDLFPETDIHQKELIHLQVVGKLRIYSGFADIVPEKILGIPVLVQDLLEKTSPGVWVRESGEENINSTALSSRRNNTESKSKL